MGFLFFQVFNNSMFPKINPKEMEKMMRQMGMKTVNIDANEVIIKLNSGGELVIANPSVQKIAMGGQESLQITGEIVERSAQAEISEDDVAIVAEKAGVSEKEARDALEEAKGDIAEAIMHLTDK